MWRRNSTSTRDRVVWKSTSPSSTSGSTLYLNRLAFDTQRVLACSHNQDAKCGGGLAVAACCEIEASFQCKVAGCGGLGHYKLMTLCDELVAAGCNICSKCSKCSA